MFERLYYAVIDLKSIFSKDRSKEIGKTHLLLLYVKIRVKSLLRKVFGIAWKQETFLGMRVYFFDYRDFFTLWREIFLWENYYFQTTSQAPFIVDAGSNIGMSVLFFKFLYPKSRILCFEPDLNAFLLLQKNIEANGLKDVEVHHAALGSVVGDIDLYRSSKDLASPGSTTTGDLFIEDKEERVRVHCLQLSKFIGDGVVDFLKMDVEGAEYGIFKDIEKNLHRVRALSMEMHCAYAMLDKSPASILEILERNGFYYAITSAHFSHIAFIKDPKAQWYITLDAYKND